MDRDARLSTIFYAFTSGMFAAGVAYHHWTPKADVSVWWGIAASVVFFLLALLVSSGDTEE